MKVVCIKGFELPERCLDCEFYADAPSADCTPWCILGIIPISNPDKRHPKCRLVELELNRDGYVS